MIRVQKLSVGDSILQLFVLVYLMKGVFLVLSHLLDGITELFIIVTQRKWPVQSPTIPSVYPE